jgi:hypothetical protein
MRLLHRYNHGLVWAVNGGFFAPPERQTQCVSFLQADGTPAHRWTLQGGGFNFCYMIPLNVITGTANGKQIWARGEYRTNWDAPGSIGGVFASELAGVSKPMWVADSKWRPFQAPLAFMDGGIQLWWWGTDGVNKDGCWVEVRNLTLWDEPTPAGWDGVQWVPQPKGWDGNSWEPIAAHDGVRWVGAPETHYEEDWSDWMTVGSSASFSAPAAWFTAGVTHYDKGFQKVKWRYSIKGQKIQYQGLAQFTQDWVDLLNPTVVRSLIISCSIPTHYVGSYPNGHYEDVIPKPTVNAMSYGVASPDKTALFSGVMVRFDAVPSPPPAPDAIFSYNIHHDVHLRWFNGQEHMPVGAWMGIDAVFYFGDEPT